MWTCPVDGKQWTVVKRMIGRKMHGEWRDEPAYEGEGWSSGWGDDVEDLPLPDPDLPGMWEPSDLIDGWADTDNESGLERSV